jgi:predicted acyltransferase
MRSLVSQTDTARTAAGPRPGRAGTEADGRAASSLGRLESIDAVRGWALVILLLALHPFPREHLPAQLKHVPWHGLPFADLFFPLFLFVMGVSMSLSSRARSAGFVLRRAGLLFLLGLALASLKHGQFYVTGVLQHIAVAYLLGWVVLTAPRRLHALMAAGLIASVWTGFLLYAGDGADPWSRQDTLAHAVDGWVIGRFATEGVLQTIVSVSAVVAGAILGRALRENPDLLRMCIWIAFHAAWLIVAGLLIAQVVPINKRLWSPSYAVLTIGTSFAWVALFVWLVDIRRYRRWVLPMRWLGANPIAVYVVFMTANALIANFRPYMPELAPLGSEVAGAMTYAFVWLALGVAFAHQLYRRRIFVKI